MQTLAVHYVFVWLKAKRLLFNYSKITKEPKQKCILDISISMIELCGSIKARFYTSAINMLKFIGNIFTHLNSFHFERCLIANWKLWYYDKTAIRIIGLTTSCEILDNRFWETYERTNYIASDSFCGLCTKYLSIWQF